MRLSTYKKLSTELYDLEDPEHRQPILHFYIQQAKTAQYPFLEPMCGTGYFLLPLLEQGADIDGIDASSDMLQVCRTKCEQHGFRPILSQQLLQDLDLPRKYGYIFIPDRSFGHLYEKEGALKALRCLYEALLPSGKLVLDVAPPPKEWHDAGNWEGEWHTRPDGSIIVSSFLLMHQEQGHLLRGLTKLEHFVNGQLVETELNEYIERLYVREEFQSLLELAGFTDIHVTKAYEDCEPGEDDRMVFLCRKETSD